MKNACKTLQELCNGDTSLAVVLKAFINRGWSYKINHNAKMNNFVINVASIKINWSLDENADQQTEETLLKLIKLLS